MDLVIHQLHVTDNDTSLYIYSSINSLYLRKNFQHVRIYDRQEPAQDGHLSEISYNMETTTDTTKAILPAQCRMSGNDLLPKNLHMII